jgi:hypothetical protein
VVASFVRLWKYFHHIKVSVVFFFLTLFYFYFLYYMYMVKTLHHQTFVIS